MKVEFLVNESLNDGRQISIIEDGYPRFYPEVYVSNHNRLKHVDL